MQFHSELERRTEPRKRGPVLGKMLIDGETRATRLRTFSSQIVYAETVDELPPSAGVVISFSAPDGPRFVLEAVAPRRVRPKARSLSRATTHGYPLRILNPPAPYLRWVQAGG